MFIRNWLLLVAAPLRAVRTFWYDLAHSVSAIWKILANIFSALQFGYPYVPSTQD